jgi:hypothetical protein
MVIALAIDPVTPTTIMQVSPGTWGLQERGRRDDVNAVTAASRMTVLPRHQPVEPDDDLRGDGPGGGIFASVTGGNGWLARSTPLREHHLFRRRAKPGAASTVHRHDDDRRLARHRRRAT